MADVTIGSQKAFTSVMNGTDSVQVVFVDDYSTIGLQVTDASGAVTVYEIAITERV